MGNSVCVKQWEIPISYCFKHRCMEICSTWGHHCRTNPLPYTNRSGSEPGRLGVRTPTKGMWFMSVSGRTVTAWLLECHLQPKLQAENLDLFLERAKWREFLHMTVGTSPNITVPPCEDVSGMMAVWMTVCSLWIFSFEIPTDLIYMSSKTSIRFVQWCLDEKYK